MDYFIALNNTQQGPFSIADLLAQGMRRDTLVWRAGMAHWQRADSLPELHSLFPAIPPMPPPPPRQPFPTPPPYSAGWQPGTQAAQASYPAAIGDNQRIIAGVLAILLGGIGVHKFVMGMPKQGIIMLLVSCTFIGYPVMHVIGIIEGVIYLTRTDQEYHQTYVLGKKAWF